MARNIDTYKLADWLATLLGERLGDLIVQLNLIQLERRQAPDIVHPPRRQSYWHIGGRYLLDFETGERV